MQEQNQPNENEILKPEDILEEYEQAKMEAVKWTNTANILSKCYTLVQNLLEQQQKMQRELEERKRKEEAQNKKLIPKFKEQSPNSIPQLMEPQVFSPTIKSINND